MTVFCVYLYQEVRQEAKPYSPEDNMTLTAINHIGPVVVRELGIGGKGVVWTVQPENFANTVDFINKNGGPSAWSVSPA